MRGPGVKPGRYDDLVHHVDVLPTLLSLAGLKAATDPQGVDLTTRLAGGPALAPRVVFSDVCKDASAYSGDHFVRVRERGEVASSASTNFARYRWSHAGQLIPRADGRTGADWYSEEASERSELSGDLALRGDFALRGALERYIAQVPAMVPAQPPDEAQRERLEALGYIEPGN